MNVHNNHVIIMQSALIQWAALTVFVEKAIWGLVFPVQVTQLVSLYSSFGINSIAFYPTGIQPVITITPDSTGVVYEPGRELIIMCEATNTFGGNIEWTSPGEPVLSIGMWSNVCSPSA